MQWYRYSCPHIVIKQLNERGNNLINTAVFLDREIHDILSLSLFLCMSVHTHTHTHTHLRERDHLGEPGVDGG